MLKPEKGGEMDNSHNSHNRVIDDKDTAVRQMTRYGAIWAKPIVTVQEGPWAGVWSDTCIWHESDQNQMEHIVGYVRIVTNESGVDYVSYRMNEDDDDTLRRFYVSEQLPLLRQLRNACEILVLMHVSYRMTPVSKCVEAPQTSLCGAMSPYETQCNADAQHVLDEPAHVDEHGHVWYDTKD